MSKALACTGKRRGRREAQRTTPREYTVTYRRGPLPARVPDSVWHYIMAPMTDSGIPQEVMRIKRVRVRDAVNKMLPEMHSFISSTQVTVLSVSGHCRSRAWNTGNKVGTKPGWESGLSPSIMLGPLVLLGMCVVLKARHVNMPFSINTFIYT